MKHVSNGCRGEDAGERIWFKGCEVFPKEINFQLQLGYSLALTEVGRSFQYFSEPKGRRVKAGDEWLPGHIIRRAKQTTLAECRALTGWYVEPGQTVAWRNGDVHSFAVLYSRFWSFKMSHHRQSVEGEKEEGHMQEIVKIEKDSLQQFGWVEGNMVRELQ